MKHRSWNKAKRWLLWLCGCALVLILAADGFWYWINITPQVKIPMPVMPKPNGFDYFQRAGAAFVEDRKGVDEVTDTEFVKDKQYPLAAKEAWLHQNAKALQLLREGLKYPALHSPIRSSTSYPEYAQYRGMTRALAVESHVRAARGDWSGAVDSMLEGYHFGNEIARGAPLIGGMVGVAVRAISLRQLGGLISHTDAATAKETAARMEKIHAESYPYSKTLEEEKWLDLASNLQMMRGPKWRIDAMHNYADPFSSDPDNQASLLNNVKVLLISKRKLINDWTNMMNALIDNARRPYAKAQPIPASGDPLVDTMLPVFIRTRWNWARYDTCGVLVETMYALRAFRLDKGHYPTSLEELVPHYLKKIPIDPYEGVAPLQYRRENQKYILWSIGPDGVDNHGTPIINKDKQGRARHLLLDPDSKGDVVAGINLP